MRKVLFLLLFLLVLGAANVSAQVRIGGDGEPNAAAVLDLNANDATDAGTKGLALPRVSLSTNTAQITSGVANLTGMLVYNTSTTLGVGIYYWDSSNWVKIVEDDGIVLNAVTDATPGGGLVRSGLGTASSPYTLGLNSSYLVGPAPEPSSLSSSVITWTKIYQGSFTTNSNDYWHIRITLPGLTGRDICLSTRYLGWVGTTYSNSLLWTNLRGNRVNDTTPFAFVCYRPSA